MERHSSNDPVSEDLRWRVDCHEAGHVVYAIRNGYYLEFAKRNDKDYGAVSLAWAPSRTPDADWSREDRENCQRFVAAGFAAERLMFGEYPTTGHKFDVWQHAEQERRLGRLRQNGFNEDADVVCSMLNPSEIEIIANLLREKQHITDDDARDALGMKRSGQEE